MPVFSLTWTWRMPSRRYSTGSSIVMIVFSREATWSSAA
jgi:hypothetical protein